MHQLVDFYARGIEEPSGGPRGVISARNPGIEIAARLVDSAWRICPGENDPKVFSRAVSSC